MTVSTPKANLPPMLLFVVEPIEAIAIALLVGVIAVVVMLGMKVRYDRRYRALKADLENHIDNETRIRAIMNATPFPIVLARQDNLQIRKYNYFAHEMIPISHEDKTESFIDTIALDAEAFRALLQRLKQEGVLCGVELQLKRRNGQAFWALLSLIPLAFSDEELLLIGFTDISRQKELEEELRHQAMTDVLTGLSSRRHFLEDAESEYLRSVRYHRSLSVLLFDIDHFKLVNDTYGHATGDAVLTEIGRLTREVIRSSDHPGRIGGDEFAVMLPESALNAAILAAQRLADRVRQTRFTTPSGVELRVTISIGVADIQTGDTGFSDAMDRADALLYQAKAEGRDRVVAADAPPQGAG